MPRDIIQGCPVCGGTLAFHRDVDGVAYFDCQGCESLLADPEVLASVDAGTFQRTYNADYWESELAAAKERSFGAGLARISELLLYARRPVNRFIDIGTGPGYLLDSVSIYLPSSRDIFWGIEMFPPEQHTANPNFVVGTLDDFSCTFDAGICMEVVEHLTPKMLRALAASLARVSDVDSLYIVNSALPHFVKTVDPGYLDPFHRGHVASYSIKAIDHIFSPWGFRTIPLRGKDWAYLLEFKPTSDPSSPIDSRIWDPIECNRKILHDPVMGNVMYVLGIETARAYL